MRRVYFHIHIWKTAGTTFLNVCRNNFGKQFCRDIMLIQNWTLSTDQLRWLLDYHMWIRCYSCHMLSGDLPYDAKDVEVIGIAFVRDPINRFVSSYTFQRNTNYRGGIAREKSFADFCIHALDAEDNPMWRNGQTYVLGKDRTEQALAGIYDRVQQGQLILLPTERFDESCMALECCFPQDFRDCSYVPYNVSRKKQEVTESQRNAISRYMDLDYKLLALANDYLDTTLERLFPTPSTLKQYTDDFVGRCETKRRRQRKVHALKYFESTIKAMAGRFISI